MQSLLMEQVTRMAVDERRRHLTGSAYQRPVHSGDRSAPSPVTGLARLLVAVARRLDAGAVAATGARGADFRAASTGRTVRA